MDGEYISSDIKIGNTPIVRLNRLEAKYNINSTLCETWISNPLASFKSRISDALIGAAIKNTNLKIYCNSWSINR